MKAIKDRSISFEQQGLFVLSSTSGVSVIHLFLAREREQRQTAKSIHLSLALCLVICRSQSSSSQPIHCLFVAKAWTRRCHCSCCRTLIESRQNRSSIANIFSRHQHYANSIPVGLVIPRGLLPLSVTCVEQNKAKSPICTHCLAR